MPGDESFRFCLLRLSTGRTFQKTAREIHNQLREINLLYENYAPTKIAETDIKGNDKPKVVVYLPDNNRD